MEAATKKKSEASPASADDFFAVDINTDEEMADFISHMSKPREEVEAPPIVTPGLEEGEQEAPAGEPELDDHDRQNLEYLNYSQEHRMTAEFLLVQLDKGFAFAFSLMSGRSMEEYRTRREKPKGEDYEAELGAALVKKYQLRMSLEYAFAIALLMRHSPMFAKAMRDRRRELNKKEEKARVDA